MTKSVQSQSPSSPFRPEFDSSRLPAERRAHRRFTTYRNIKISARSGAVAVTLRDISRGGARLLAPDFVGGVGEVVELALPLDENVTCGILSEIVRTEELAEGHTIGVRFSRVDSELRSSLDKWIDALAEKTPDTRHDPRTVYRVAVRYHNPNEAVAILGDISRGGLSMTVRETLSIGQEIVVAIPPPSGKEHLFFKACVRNQQPLASAGIPQHRVGLSFAALSPPELEKLDHLLKEIQSGGEPSAPALPSDLARPIAGGTGGRAHPRVEACFRLRYTTMDELVVGYTRNLSKNGMFLGTDRVLPQNAVLQIRVELPGTAGHLSIIARVAHVRNKETAKATGKPAGMGVQFLDAGEDGLKQIERLIAEHCGQSDAGPEAEIAKRPLRILVVDDEERFRQLAAAPFLRRKDLVTTARDGIEALAACIKEPPDLIISDVQMPRMNGWQLLRAIRSRPSLSWVPFVFLSSLSGEKERLFGYKLGVDDYIGKSYRQEDFEARVDRMVMRIEQGPRRELSQKTLRGDLEQVSLPSVLSFLELERKTGILLLASTGRTARLFLYEGRLLRAEIDGRRAEGSAKELALEVLATTSGQFEFDAQELPPTHEAGLGVTELLLEHARRTDEAERSQD